MNTNLNKKILILFIIFILAIFLGITKGSINIPLKELLLNENRPIILLRLLRIILAIVLGSGLAVSGVGLQAILRNPLAEPYLLGASSAAGLGAILAILIGISSIYLPFIAFLAAALIIILVYNLAKRDNKIPPESLVLSGVIVSVAISGLIIFLISIADNESLHGTMWWLWGSMQIYNIGLLSIVSIVVALGIIIIYILAQDLNAISIGEEEAIHLGVNIEITKKMIFFITSLITASLVSICGIIGFVGLIIPHMMRFIVGPNHKILIPCTCIAAAAFMIICDLISRSILPPLEIPIGVITAIVGAPIFIVLLKNKQKIR